MAKNKSNSNNNQQSTQLLSELTELLKINKNLILTGAPGTGKTFLARKIAEELAGKTSVSFDQLKKDGQVEFVQFHPSYDYTDFVEGLRPIDDETNKDALVFKRQDGIFKAFCAKAKDNWDRSQLSDRVTQIKEKAKEVLQDWAENIINSDDEETDSNKVSESQDCSQTNENVKSKNEFSTGKLTFKLTDFNYGKKSIICKRIRREGGSTEEKEFYIRKEDLVKLIVDLYEKKDGNKEIINEVKDSKSSCNYFKRKNGTAWQADSYIPGLVEELSKIAATIKEEDKTQEELKKYIFIIDEINRGELNKIFGELLFSIDPDYRGPQHLVSTQYQALVKDQDEDFAEGFYVPENVYIIGTMNDIDRNVESIDFAIRRRFAWREISYKDTMSEIIKGIKPGKRILKNQTNKIVNKINAINKCIVKPEFNLGTAYQIGASYFKKLSNYKKNESEFDFDKLWNYHLKGVIFEYLRGRDDVNDILTQIENEFKNA